jgi:DNA-binding IclR family transcriptional regulator
MTMKKPSPLKVVDSEADRAESMKSLRTALRVLSEFDGPQRDLGVVELAERCGLAKSRVSKVLDAFAEYGLLFQDTETRRYSAGLRTYTLGSRYLTHNALCGAAIPVMRDLLARTGHSVRLSILDGDRVLYLIGLEGPLFIDTGWRSGNLVPPGAGSAGRVLMAFMEPEQVERMLAQPIEALTRYTVTDKAKIAKIIQKVRATGYAMQCNETTEGLGVMSVPLFGADRHPIGALGLAFPAHIDIAPDEADLVALLHEAARIVSQRMGCDVYPFGGGGKTVRPAARETVQKRRKSASASRK